MAIKQKTFEVKKWSVEYYQNPQPPLPPHDVPDSGIPRDMNSCAAIIYLDSVDDNQSGEGVFSNDRWEAWVYFYPVRAWKAGSLSPLPKGRMGTGAGKIQLHFDIFQFEGIMAILNATGQTHCFFDESAGGRGGIRKGSIPTPRSS